MWWPWRLWIIKDYGMLSFDESVVNDACCGRSAISRFYFRFLKIFWLTNLPFHVCLIRHVWLARRLDPHESHSFLRSNLVHVRDPVPTLQRRTVIYQITCSGCDRNYTEQAGRLLGTRLKEHRGSVRRHYTNSCLALHCMDTGSVFNWQDSRMCQLAKGMWSNRSPIFGRA